MPDAPYYQDEAVTLYHRDWRDLPFGPSWANVLITDPPYGIRYRSNRPRQTVARSIHGDSDTSLRDEALRWWGDKPAAVFGSWQRPRPPGTRMLLVWDTKGALGMGDTKLPWKPAHQEIYILGAGWHGRRGSDVIVCAPVQSLGYNGRLHPHQKPVELMAHLVDRAPAGLILDPFCGSGATLVAAKAAGRHAIGAEVDESYCEATAKRLSQGVLNFGGAA